MPGHEWIMEDLPVGVWVARVPGGDLEYANHTFAEILGMAARDDVAAGEYAAPYGIHDRDGNLYPEDRMPFVRAIEARETVLVDDLVIHRHDGRKVYIRAQARPVFDDEGMTHVIIAFIDITPEVEAEKARSEAEARLFRAQKMESIGLLAGGIAHDFNNLLGTIKLLTSTLVLGEEDEERLEVLGQVDQVTDSAVQLTHALLGFARRGRHLARPVGLNAVVADLAPILSRTIGVHIQVETDLGAVADGVVGDQGQLEQVLMNLVVNARDAMADGGRLTLRTLDLSLDAAEAARRGLTPGGWVVLEVADSGVGIDPAIRDRVFEPYFTTRDGLQAGSGLGLAVVWGIVEGHGGIVDIEDRPEGGTLVRVFLPTIGSGPPVERAPAASVRHGSGCVLLVDDDPGIRASGRMALEALGYEVLCARDGIEAVRILREDGERILVVVLDLVMPRLDGRGTWEAIRDLAPHARVLLTTASAMNEEVQSLLDLGAHGFVPKPFSVGLLSEAVSDLLDP